jgi:hypothetical protein
MEKYIVRKAFENAENPYLPMKFYGTKRAV